ncbi:lipopolysaccharide 1,2-glucosyltransferase RfaJ [Anopheles sinensis]|uniref:Lipopolysaccharide 1,2-glucosyltransferase RfaJ n=1 Tax=Anopheles sinensis TaxID=74873 RepID=A0A084VWP0_ANOSI|nr:lipopolysaccharide 1,2-glucosyltransferase RfaJ [Anopheles sinensis]
MCYPMISTLPYTYTHPIAINVHWRAGKQKQFATGEPEVLKIEFVRTFSACATLRGVTSAGGQRKVTSRRTVGYAKGGQMDDAENRYVALR